MLQKDKKPLKTPNQARDSYNQQNNMQVEPQYTVQIIKSAFPRDLPLDPETFLCRFFPGPPQYNTCYEQYDKYQYRCCHNGFANVKGQP